MVNVVVLVVVAAVIFVVVVGPISSYALILIIVYSSEVCVRTYMLPDGCHIGVQFLHIITTIIILAAAITVTSGETGLPLHAPPHGAAAAAVPTAAGDRRMSRRVTRRAINAEVSQIRRAARDPRTWRGRGDGAGRHGETRGSEGARRHSSVN